MSLKTRGQQSHAPVWTWTHSADIVSAGSNRETEPRFAYTPRRQPVLRLDTSHGMTGQPRNMPTSYGAYGSGKRQAKIHSSSTDAGSLC